MKDRMVDTGSIKITVLLFGQAREMVGESTVEVEVGEPATVESAFAVLKTRHPKLAQMERSLLFAVNEEYASREDRLSENDRLAVLPPVSGGEPLGKDVFEITREPIDIQGLRARVLEGASGAVVIFDGVARNNTKGRATLFLEYEGYTEMALQIFEQIGDEA